MFISSILTACSPNSGIEPSSSSLKEQLKAMQATELVKRQKAENELAEAQESVSISDEQGLIYTAKIVYSKSQATLQQQAKLHAEQEREKLRKVVQVKKNKELL